MITFPIGGTCKLNLNDDKDFEKVSLKNDSEILIAKHHGNETIIFETKKDAKEFQEKVFEMKHKWKGKY